MYTIQLEITSRLAERLAPYRTRLPELLELGLQVREEEDQSRSARTTERLLKVLAESGRVNLPQRYPINRSYTRHTPVPITGHPVSELVIEQRGD